MVLYEDAQPLGDRFRIIDRDDEKLKITCEAVLQDVDGLTIEEFLLEVNFSAEQKHKFPKVRELQDKIPIDRERHVNADGSFCLAVVQEEILQCKRGLNFELFVDEVILPYLANQTLISRGIRDNFVLGEYPHEADGILHYYVKLIPNIHPNRIAQMVRFVINRGVPRNRKCPCGSGKNVKNCHVQLLEELMEIGNEQLGIDLDILSGYGHEQTPPPADE